MSAVRLLTPPNDRDHRQSFRFASENGAALIFFSLLFLLPLVLDGYPIYILPQYMLYGLLAMSLGLIWGYGGLVSFGQGAFFALGAYAMGFLMKVGFGPINPGYLGLLAAVTCSAAVAAFAGYFLFSAGVRQTYFILITLALSIIFEQLAVSQSDITGGYNGMFVNRMDLTFGPFGTVSLANDVAIYYTILPVVLICYFLLRWLVASKFGKILEGIRENEDRMIALGHNPVFYKTLAFTASGAVAGLAGAFYSGQANFVSPPVAGVLFSTQVVVWVAIGGRNSLLGALVGGVGIAYLTNYLSSLIPNYWQLIVGLIFIVVIAFFKGGVAGTLGSLVGRRR